MVQLYFNLFSLGSNDIKGHNFVNLLPTYDHSFVTTLVLHGMKKWNLKIVLIIMFVTNKYTK